MRYAAAYMLLRMGGKEAPTKDDVKALLDTVGIKLEDETSDAFFKAIADKKADDLIADGTKKLETALAGAGGGGGGGGGGAGGGAAAAAEPEEESEEESSEKGLFGGSDSDSSS